MERSIELRLFASLQRFIPNPEGRCPITPPTRIRDIVERLGIPVEEAKLIFVDGRRGDLNTVLNGGERVGIFPPVGGG
ncbi:MAG: MoaD/ThiS family protein [Thermodesulfobacteriota bacterium]